MIGRIYIKYIKIGVYWWRDRDEKGGGGRRRNILKIRNKGFIYIGNDMLWIEDYD